MSTDNRQFNVNGKSKELLYKTLSLALEQDGTSAVRSFRYTPEKGLILMWGAADSKSSAFPVPISNPGTLADIVWEWLQTKEAEECLSHLDPNGFDFDIPHDGHNSKGWRVYCEDWGYVDLEQTAIVAIKPVYLWYGK